MTGWAMVALVVAQIHIKGFVCAYCAQGLMQTFREQPGVVRVDASIEEETVIVRAKESAHLTKEGLKKTVEDGGFDVVSITIKTEKD